MKGKENVEAESDLVVALAKGDASRLRLALTAIADWKQVPILAAQHQVDALSFWMSRSGDLTEAASPARDLPRCVQECFCASFIYHSYRAQSLISEIERIVNALRNQMVEAIFLKGPWIALHAYPHPGARPVGDIDLCIRESHYRESLTGLRAVGYEPRGLLPSTVRDAVRQAHFGKQIRLSAASGRPLELHFRLKNFGLPTPDEDWVWNTSREVEVGTSKIRVPGPEAMLLSLLLHANQHRFAVLRLLHDIRWALERDGSLLDVDLFHAQVRRLRCAASIYHALLLARDLAGAQIPPGFLEGSCPPAARRLSFGVTWSLRAVRRLRARRWPQSLEAPLFYLLEVGTVREKAQFFAGLIDQAGGLTRFLAQARRGGAGKPREP